VDTMSVHNERMEKVLYTTDRRAWYILGVYRTLRHAWDGVQVTGIGMV
jgi:hypothetical protein